MAVGYPPVAVTEGGLPPGGLTDHQPLEDPMGTPVPGGSPLELQEDCMAVRPQGVPTVSHLRIPTDRDLTDRDLLRVSRGLGLQVPLTLFSVIQGPSLPFLWVCRQPGPRHPSGSRVHQRSEERVRELAVEATTPASPWLTTTDVCSRRSLTLTPSLLLTCQQLTIWLPHLCALSRSSGRSSPRAML